MKDINKFKETSIEYHREIASLKKEREDCIEEKRDIEALLMMNPVEEIKEVSNGQAVLNIKLPKTSELSAYNWICLAGYFDEMNEYQTNASFLVQIK